MKEYFYRYRWGVALLVGVILLMLSYLLVVQPAEQRLSQLKNTRDELRRLSHRESMLFSAKQIKSMVTFLRQAALKEGIVLDMQADEADLRIKRWRGKGPLSGWLTLQQRIQTRWPVLFDLQKVSVISNQLLEVEALIRPLSQSSTLKSSFPSTVGIRQRFCQAMLGGVLLSTADRAQLTAFNAFHLVGIARLADKTRAFFQLPSGQLLRVQVGDSIGLEGYRVAVIARDQVTIQKTNGQVMLLGLMR